MIQIDSVVNKNATLVTEASAASRNLTGQAEALVRSVSIFQLPDEAAPPHAARPAAQPSGQRLALLAGAR